ncbi:MAG TPA: PLP-dependent aminotransferase family protein [Solirubrobacteraceae bacterium]|nr:PLP-dependent aminotransferase family protein [Solirubrobacteraceae bacterium]
MHRATAEHFDEASSWALEPRPGETLRACLERTLRDAIREGSLRAGVELPASRRLAAQLGVSRGVASDAYAELEAQGYLQVTSRRRPVVAEVAGARPRVATVSAPTRTAPRYDLTPTTPDVTLFPRRQWAAALAAAVRDASATSLDSGDPRGSLVLRERLADELGRTRGVICDPDQVLIVQGTTQGVDLVLRVLRATGATRIAVEDPSLDRQHRQIAALGLELVGQPVDRDGLIVAGLEADAVIVSPAHQFPTGAVLSGSRRRELLAWSRDTSALILEDDYDAEFRYDREPVRALQGLDPERVIYAGTTSKTLAPALRIGWLVVPEPLVEPLSAMKVLLDDLSPTLEQLALAQLLERGHYQRHIRRTRGVYRARRDRLAVALAEHFPERSVFGVAAGLSVMLDLPSHTDDRALERLASNAGVRVEALSRYAIQDRGRRGLVIGYGRVHEAAVAPAMAALRAAIAPVLG